MLANRKRVILDRGPSFSLIITLQNRL